MTEAEKIIDEKRRKKIKDLADLSRQVDKKYGESKWLKRGDDKAEYAQGIPGMAGSILDIKGSNTERMRREHLKSGYGGDTPSITDIIKRLIALKDADAGTELTEEEKAFERVHGGKSSEMSKVRLKKRIEDNKAKRKTKKDVVSY